MASCISFYCIGQNQQMADSLIAVVESGMAEESTKIKLYLNISRSSTNPNQMIKYGELALASSRINESPKFIGNSYSALGHAYRLKGVLTKSIDYYFKAIAIYQKINYSIGIAACYSHLGDVYQVQEDYQKSKQYFHQARKIFSSEENELRFAISTTNLGETERLNMENDSALYHFHSSLAYFQKLDYHIGIAYNLGNIGLVYAEQGKHEQAEQNMNQAIVILEELGDRYPIAVYQTSLSDIYAERGEYNRALKYANSSLNIGLEEGLKEQIRDASLKLSELYKSVGNSDEAYTYLKQYITYRDSINNEETIRKMADLRTEYEVNKKQVEVDLLSEQAKLNRIVAWSAVCIIALLLVLTIALLKIYRIKDRAVRIVRQRRRVIAAQRNRLDEVNKTKDRFFSIVSHDIRGPISNFQGISGLINVLADSKDVEGLKQLGSMMESSAKEVSVLLDNLLEWALSQEGRIPYNPQSISLREISQSNLSIMLNLAIAKNIDLVGKLPTDVEIRADKNSVSTIIRNLLSNAIKFTPEGGNVTLEISEYGGYGIIQVKDSGIGIPKDKLENLFSLKGTRSQWGTKGEKGIGLGLLLVHEFVELNNGRIEVESTEGKGTEFKVILPKGLS